MSPSVSGGSASGMGVTPNLSAYDRSNGQPGMYGTPQGAPPNGTVALTANRLFMLRFVPSRGMRIVTGAFGVSVAASLDDHCDIGIYDANGAIVQRVGDTAGKLNATGTKTMTLAAPAVLTPGAVYYSAFMGAVGGTAATLGGFQLGTGFAVGLFDTGLSTLPNAIEGLFLGGAGGALPATAASGLSGIANCPCIAWRES